MLGPGCRTLGPCLSSKMAKPQKAGAQVRWKREVSGITRFLPPVRVLLTICLTLAKALHKLQVSK